MAGEFSSSPDGAAVSSQGRKSLGWDDAGVYFVPQAVRKPARSPLVGQEADRVGGSLTDVGIVILEQIDEDQFGLDPLQLRCRLRKVIEPESAG